MDGGLRNLSGRYLDNVKLTFAVTDYRHDEIETEDGIESLGTRFDNDTNSLRLELEQKRAGRLSGRLGIDWLGRDYLATGAEALAPPTTQHGFSAFAYEEMAFQRFRLQFGGRVEQTNYDVDEGAVGEERPAVAGPRLHRRVWLVRYACRPQDRRGVRRERHRRVTRPGAGGAVQLRPTRRKSRVRDRQYRP